MAMNNDFKVLLQTELDTKNIVINVPDINKKLADNKVGLRFKVDTNYIKEQLKSLTVNLDTSKAKIDPKEYFKKDAYKSAEVLASKMSLFEKNLIAQEKLTTAEKEKQLKIEKERIEALEKERQKRFRELGEEARTKSSVSRGMFVSKRGFKERSPKLTEESRSTLKDEYSAIIDKIRQYKKALDSAKTAEDRTNALKGLRKQRVALQDFNHDVIFTNKTEQEKLRLLKQEESLVTSVNNARAISKRNIDDIEKKTKTSDVSKLRVEYKNIEQSIKKYEAALRSAETAEDRDKAIKGLKEQKVALQGLNHATTIANKNAEKFSYVFSNALKKFSTWLSVSTIMMKSIQTLKKMLDIVVELDKAFTNIQMATGATDIQIKELQKSYTELARAMHTTVQEVASGADNWLRQGMSIEETNKALQASIVFSKVAGIANADATTLLTSAMKGYKLTANELISIVDKLSAVDMKSASSSQDLAIAMSYGASVAESAGFSFDKYIAIIATAKDITQQSAETIGTALKSIITRMGQVKAGVEVDEFGESLNNVETVLKKNTISLRNQAGEFRNFESVLEEVAQKWDTLTKVQQNQVSTAIAGTRQVNIFSTIMKEYDKVLELTETSMQSNGTAMEKFGTYSESVEAKINNLKTSIASVAQESIDTNAVKGLIDFGTKILDVASNVGGLLTLIPLLIGVISTLKLITEATTVAYFNHKNAIAIANLEMQKMTITTSALKASMGALMLIISGAVMIYGKVAQARKEAIQAQEKEIAKNNEQVESLKKLKDEYISLSSITDKTDSQKERLNNISKILTEQYGLEKLAINDVNNSLDSQIAKIDEAIAKRNELSMAIMKGDYDTAKAEMGESYKKTFATEGGIRSNAQERNLKPYKKALDDIKGVSFNSQGAFEILGTLEEQKTAIEEIIKVIGGDKKLSHITNEFTKELDKLNVKITDNQKIISEYESMQGYNEFVKKHGKAINEFKKQQSDFMELSEEEQKNQVSILRTAFDNLLNSMTSEEDKEYIKSLAADFLEVESAINKADYALIAMNKQMALLKKEQALEKEKLERKEKEAALEKAILETNKAQLALEEARNQKARVYRKGKGFVYEEDFSKVQGAKSQLQQALEAQEKAKEALEGTEIEQKMKKLETLMEIYNQAMLDGVKVGDDTIREYFKQADNLTAFEEATYEERLKILKSFLNEKHKLEVGDKGEIGGGLGFTPNAPSLPPPPPTAVEVKKTWRDSQESLNAGEYAENYSGYDKRNIHTAKAILDKVNINGAYTKKIANMSAFLQSDYETYHNGGVVGGDSSPKLKTNEEFAKLMKKEVVVNVPQQKAILNNFNNKQLESGFVNNIGTINLPNVQDYNGFINAMKRIGTSSLQKVMSRR